jgi:hypothetical protein
MPSVVTLLARYRWAIASALGGTIVGWILFSAVVPPIPAQATACGQSYNVVGWQSGGGMHRGDRVQNPGMFIWGTVGACAHISTLDAYSSAFEQAEAGWINQSNVSVVCFNIIDSTPHNFYAYIDDGFQVCKQSTDRLTPGTWSGYAVQDTSADHRWFWFKNGTQQWPSSSNGTYLSYLYGDILANGERHGSTGSAEAHFTGLQYDTVNGWGPWDSTHLFCDTVDNWDLDVLSNTEIHVYSASNVLTCPFG